MRQNPRRRTGAGDESTGHASPSITQRAKLRFARGASAGCLGHCSAAESPHKKPAGRLIGSSGATGHTSEASSRRRNIVRKGEPRSSAFEGGMSSPRANHFQNRGGRTCVSEGLVTTGESSSGDRTHRTNRTGFVRGPSGAAFSLSPRTSHREKPGARALASRDASVATNSVGSVSDARSHRRNATNLSMIRLTGRSPSRSRGMRK